MSEEDTCEYQMCGTWAQGYVLSSDVSHDTMGRHPGVRRRHHCTTAASDSAPRALPRSRSRLVHEDVYRPLTGFRDAAELLQVMFHALAAHVSVWNKAQILHGDVSVNNILIHDTTSGSGRALLVDWDLPLSEDPELSIQPSRPGTRHFMSALAQCYPQKPHQVSDDLESFVHVLNWCAYKYLKHSDTGKPLVLAYVFAGFYDEPLGGGAPLNSSPKYLQIMTGYPLAWGLPDRAGNPLAKLLWRLAELCKEHYTSAEVMAYCTKPQDSPNTPPVFTRESAISNTSFREELQELVRPLCPKEDRPERSTSDLLSDSVQKESPLKDHVYVVRAFLDVYRKGDWPKEGLQKLPDQVPRHVKPSSVSSRRGSTASPNSSADS
ncbi:hypothetical protein OH77DRAFT_1423094 [Trametes cingulata]|nr:hypothetical protein OH77DRAFT_1423094 [Trametes cingulata]